jgi:hypothetical protein
MDWIRDLTEENFLAVYDVALDIHADLQLGQKPRIPMVPSIVRFPMLMPMNGANMRDRYGNLRWKAMDFLKRKEFIKKIDILQGGHRWETRAEIEVDNNLFQKLFTFLEEEYHQRMHQEGPAPETHSGDTPVTNIRPASTEFEKVTLPWLYHHVPIKLLGSAVPLLITVFIIGIYAGQIGFVKFLFRIPVNIEKDIEKNEKVKEPGLPRKYWLELDGKTTTSFLDGQILITLKSMTSDGPNFEIKIPDKPIINKCIVKGGRIEFEYLGNTYFLSVLELGLANNIKGVEIELSKKKFGG